MVKPHPSPVLLIALLVASPNATAQDLPCPNALPETFAPGRPLTTEIRYKLAAPWTSNAKPFVDQPNKSIRDCIVEGLEKAEQLGANVFEDNSNFNLNVFSQPGIGRLNPATSRLGQGFSNIYLPSDLVEVTHNNCGRVVKPLRTKSGTCMG